METVKAAWASNEREDWPTLLRLVHPLALQEFRQRQIDMMSPRQLTARDSLRDSLSEDRRARLVASRGFEDRFRQFYATRVLGLTSLGQVDSLQADSLLLR
ncbi:MAG TPA: hypothetical protein VMG41_12160, partial [Gemmatimonadales bacterium]|nr:hypothetical protein [Gemmatimonadales bacterium]